MALNAPQTAAGGLPLPFWGELFILQREGIQFQFEGTSTSGNYVKLSGTGVLIVTSIRMVFVAKPPPRYEPSESVMHAFDMPYVFITEEKFNQPIFGANNLTGRAQAVEGGDLQGSAKFRITFKEGGVGTFLPIFFSLIAESRRAAAPERAAAVSSSISSGSFVQQAYVDPSDPSRLYIVQPFQPPPPQPSAPPAPAYVAPSAYTPTMARYQPAGYS